MSSRFGALTRAIEELRVGREQGPKSAFSGLLAQQHGSSGPVPMPRFGFLGAEMGPQPRDIHGVLSAECCALGRQFWSTAAASRAIETYLQVVRSVALRIPCAFELAKRANEAAVQYSNEVHKQGRGHKLGSTHVHVADGWIQGLIEGAGGDDRETLDHVRNLRRGCARWGTERPSNLVAARISYADRKTAFEVIARLSAHCNVRMVHFSPIRGAEVFPC